MVTFAMELTAGILAISFQEKVIAELKVDLGSKLQNEYGVHSSFTAAIDLVQTKVIHFPKQKLQFIDEFSFVFSSSAVELIHRPNMKHRLGLWRI